MSSFSKIITRISRIQLNLRNLHLIQHQNLKMPLYLFLRKILIKKQFSH